MTRKTVPDRANLAATHERDVVYGYNVLDLTTFARFDSNGGEGVTQTWDALGRMLTSTINMDAAAAHSPTNMMRAAAARASPIPTARPTPTTSTTPAGSRGFTKAR
jgi:YD repeat-containing protein